MAYLPGSALSLKEMGAFVTPPLGWQWDGDVAEWEAYPGAFLWMPPRRPLRRFVRRLDATRNFFPPPVHLYDSS